MGIGLAVGVAVTMPVAFGCWLGHFREGLQALGRHHGQTFVAGRFGEVLGPRVKAQTVAHQQLTLQQRFSVTGFGFKHMRVFIGADQIGDLDALAADHPNQVTQNAEAGGDG